MVFLESSFPFWSSQMASYNVEGKNISITHGDPFTRRFNLGYQTKN